MKFACPKCKTRYSVADDKLPAEKTLRFTCKKCSNVFKLRRKPKTGAPAGPTAMDSEEEAATRVANLSEIMAVKRRSREAPDPAPPASPFVHDDEWFVLAGGKQKGPLAVSEIEDLLKARAIDRRTYVWRDGMGDWARLSSVPELAELAPSGEPAPAGARPPAQPMDEENTDETVAMDDAKLQQQLARLRDVTGGAGARGDREAALASLVGEPTGDTLSRGPDDDFDPDLDDFDLENAGPTKERPIPDFASEGSGPTPGGGVFDAASSDPFFDNAPLAAPSQPPDYFNAAPGEATRVFMATAGLYRRRRNQKLAAVAGITCTVALAATIALDIAGFIEIPGMGAVYDLTGVEDPNAERAIARVDEALADDDLSPEERAAIERRRAALRAKLMGGATDGGRAGRKGKARAAAEGRAAPAAQVGIEEAAPVSAEEHDITAAIMGDARKSSRAPTLRPPTELQTPNLPDGLTQDSIFEVINRNQRAMSLCISQSMKAGEKLDGKMEVEMSIAANGSVESASIGTARFVGTTIGECTVRTVRRWKFPRFNGQPVTVIFPYVLSAGF